MNWATSHFICARLYGMLVQKDIGYLLNVINRAVLPRISLRIIWPSNTTVSNLYSHELHMYRREFMAPKRGHPYCLQPNVKYEIYFQLIVLKQFYKYFKYIDSARNLDTMHWNVYQ
jgi:hypothetical protein